MHFIHSFFKLAISDFSVYIFQSTVTEGVLQRQVSGSAWRDASAVWASWLGRWPCSPLRLPCASAHPFLVGHHREREEPSARLWSNRHLKRTKVWAAYFSKREGGWVGGSCPFYINSQSPSLYTFIVVVHINTSTSSFTVIFTYLSPSFMTLRMDLSKCHHPAIFCNSCSSNHRSRL